MFIKKEIIEKSRQHGEYKKRNSKTWSEEAIDTLINCFQSPECLWNLDCDYRVQNNKSLALEQADMSLQESDMIRYDYHKNGLISEANSYEIYCTT